MAIRRETSAETSARFIASQRRRARLQNRPLTSRRAASCRVTVNFAEPTLRLIHDVLIDAMHANVDFGSRGALLLIAEQMVATALGEPACDGPPLTDLEVK